MSPLCKILDAQWFEDDMGKLEEFTDVFHVSAQTSKPRAEANTEVDHKKLKISRSEEKAISKQL